MKNITRGSKIITIKFWLISAILVAIILASCAPEGPSLTETATTVPTLARTATRKPTSVPEVTPTPTEPPRLEIDPEDLEGSVVQFAHPWVGEPAEVFETIAAEFSLSNPWGISVEVYPYGGETVLIDVLQANLAEGEMPGLVAAPPYLLSALGEDYSQADLNPYFNDPDWGLSADDREDIIPVFLDQFTLGERMVALPFAPQVTVLFYNQTWGAELGFTDPPADLNSFRRQTCDATFANWQDDNKQGGTGGWLINLDPAVLVSWIYAFEGVLPDQEIPEFNTQAGREAFGYLWDIKNQGCIWFGLQPDPYAYFADRIALMYAGRLDQIPVQVNWMEAAGSEDAWEVIGFPGPAGETVLVDGPGLMITADTPENELAAWLFARHLIDPEVQAEIVQSLFSLPVRESTMDLLADFVAEYPQWAQGAAMVDSASALPISEAWGISQWVLQDAVNRILQSETNQVPQILTQLDDMILDLQGISP